MMVSITTNMGEPEALEAIKNGYVKINDKVYSIEKEPHGWCDGCAFLGTNCPTLARHICCTGGMILKEE